MKTEKPFMKGEITETEITDVTDQGKGVGKPNGFTLFVDKAEYGQIVKAEIKKVKKRYGLAKVIEVIKESPYKAEDVCPYIDECGGCPFGKITYEGQLKIKNTQVKDKLQRIGKLENPKVNPVVASERQTRYRNKAVMAISTGGITTIKGGAVVANTDPVIGFYNQNSRKIADIKDCRIQKEPAMAAAEAVRQFMKEDGITAWDPKWEKGLMRHMTVRTAETGEVMVIFVINGKGIPGEGKLIQMLDDAICDLPPREDGIYYSLESVAVNVDKAKDTAEKIAGIYGEKTRVIAGSDTINEISGDTEYEISPMSFYQVNPSVMPLLYDKAMEYAEIKEGDTVFDLYCGAGGIGLEAAKRGAGKVIGIESVHSAILDANRNASINRIVNARYLEGKAEEVLPKLLKEPEEGEKVLDDWYRVEKADVIFLDPPRKGCDQRLLDAAAETEADRIVFVSCDPATLARDIAYLEEKGYEFKEASPFDMFPETVHVECVALLTKAGQ